jgi:hypothetical protein
VTASLGANWVPTSPFHPRRGYAKSLQPFNGEVPERSNGAVSKTESGRLFRSNQCQRMAVFLGFRPVQML